MSNGNLKQVGISWQSPIILSYVSDKDIPLGWGSRELRQQFFSCDLDLIPKQPGVYFFARKNHGKSTPLYIGESLNLYNEVKGNLKNKHIMDYVRKKTNRSGYEACLFVGKLQRKRSKRITRMVERALIDHAIIMKYPIINESNTLDIDKYNIKSTKHPHHMPFPSNLIVASKNGVTVSLPNG